MKKDDLKKLIKPLVKECIHEVLLEEGLLSNVVAEVTKGMQAGMIVEAKQQPAPVNDNIQIRQKTANTNAKLREHRKKLMDSINTDAYNGVNLFEGTEPMSGHPSASPKAGSADLGNPGDAGVDISSLLGGASKIWQAMK